MKKFSILFLLLAITACTKRPLTEEALLNQLKGGRCSFFAEDPGIPLMENYQSKCYPVQWYHVITVRNYASKCKQSASTCLLELNEVSPMAIRDVKEFLEKRSDEVDTSGEGSLKIRCSAAIVYAKIAGKESIPLIEETLIQASGSSDAAQQNNPRSSIALLKKALEIARGVEVR